ncbi:hypothetical protein ACFR9U_15920, partial [Halorientalis brevis]
MTRESYTCDLCHREHPTKANALRCCSDKFDDDQDTHDKPAFTAPDEHGCPIVTDGGCSIPQGETFQDPWRYRCPECQSTLIRRKTGPRAQRENPE